MTAGRRSLSESTSRRRRWRWLVPLVVVLLAGIGFVGRQWWTSRVPDTYSMSDMGTADFGGGPAHDHSAAGGAGTVVEVADLTGPASGEPDVSYELTARQEGFRLASGEDVQGYTVDGSSPGPVLQAEQGDLVQVTLVNDNVADGATLHWHGVDVPNAEDGVAGVTQDAVLPGQRHVYRFVAEDAGTFWYHSHQVSHEQVRGGLLDRKSTRLNSSHANISYAVFCLKKEV